MTASTVPCGCHLSLAKPGVGRPWKWPGLLQELLPPEDGGFAAQGLPGAAPEPRAGKRGDWLYLLRSVKAGPGEPSSGEPSRGPRAEEPGRPALRGRANAEVPPPAGRAGPAHRKSAPPPGFPPSALQVPGLPCALGPSLRLPCLKLTFFKMSSPTPMILR